MTYLQRGCEYRASLKLSGIQIPFELQTKLVWYSDHHLNIGHLNTGQVKVHYSDVFSDPQWILKSFTLKQINQKLKLAFGKLQKCSFKKFVSNSHWAKGI